MQEDSALRRLIDSIKPKLRDYLEQQGHPLGERNFLCCISKYHDDHNPSMHLVPRTGDTYLRCFSCGAAMDIFIAAHHLENLPIDGPEFIRENVFVLADRFGIPREGIELSPEEVEFYKLRSLMRDAADVFLEQMDARYAGKRGWTEETCKRFETGTIANLNAFYAEIQRRGGWTNDQLARNHIAGNHRYRFLRLFGSDRMTFLLRDVKGQPVGFACRNYSQTNPNPKWINTAGFDPKTEAGSKLYDKSSYLYGFREAIEALKEGAGTRLDIYEGYGDVISARLAGHRLCVAICGTSFTTEHVDMIRKAGFTWINLVLDDDQAGRKRMLDYLDQCTGIEGLRVTVGFLAWHESIPEHDRDPDTWFRNYPQIETYERFLTTFDAFEWELRQLTAGTFDPVEVTNRMIDHLQNEPNVVLRGRKMEKLAEATGRPVGDIAGEFGRRFNGQIDDTISRMRWRVEKARNTQERIEVLKETIRAIEQRSGGPQMDVTQSEVSSAFRTFLTKTRERRNVLSGWDTGYPQLNDATDGIPKAGQTLAFAGHSNSGKSAMLLNVAMNLVTNEANRNLSVLYWALDDPRETVFARMTAILSGLPIKDCAHYQRVLDFDPVRQAAYHDATHRLIDLLNTGRLSVKGETMGNTIEDGEAWVKAMQQETGNHVVMVVDSFHNVMIDGADNESERLTEVSGWFRRNTEVLNFTALATMECNKMGLYEARPRMTHLHGSRKLQFDTKWIGMIYNEVNTLKDQATIYWKEDGVVHPVVECMVDKNKIGNGKPRIFYKLQDETSQMFEIPPEQVRQVAFHGQNASMPGAPTSGPISYEFTGF